MSTVCLIPARGGSSRIPRKNVKMFHGKPIIAYSIEVAQKSRLFNDIVVSTDSVWIECIANDYGASVYHRSKKMGEDSVGTQEVAQEYVIDERNRFVDTLCVLYATAPLLDVNHLMLGKALLDSGAAYAFSVGENPLHDAGQFYWGAASSFRKGIPLIGSWSRIVAIPPERDCDINTPEDWERAEKMYAKLKGIQC